MVPIILIIACHLTYCTGNYHIHIRIHIKSRGGKTSLHSSGILPHQNYVETTCFQLYKATEEECDNNLSKTRDTLESVFFTVCLDSIPQSGSRHFATSTTYQNYIRLIAQL